MTQTTQVHRPNPGAIACVLVALGVSAHAQLLHRYDFSSGARDSVGTANGTLEGSSTITGGALLTSNQTSGQWSGGAPLAGVMLPSSAVAGITGPFTIETWFQAASQSDWPKFQTTFSFSDGTINNYVLATPVRGYSPWPSSVAVIGGGGNTSEQLVQGIYLDTPSVHQQLVTYDGTTLTYYIDGALANFSGYSATASDPGLNLSTLTDIGIGGGSPWPDNALDGQTFDFRIYGQALTADQAAAVYALGADASNSSISNAAVTIFNQNFDGGYTGAFSPSYYYSGAPIDYTNYVVSSGGNPNGAWQETMTATTWSDYYGGQLNLMTVSGNTDTNPSDYVLSFDAYGSQAAKFTVFLQCWQSNYFTGAEILNTPLDEVLSASNTWQTFRVNLGTIPGANPTGATWQLSFQIGSRDWGGPGQTNTLTVDNVVLTEQLPAQTTYIGNSLSVSNGAPDSGRPLVILGEYSLARPLATSPVTLPSGMVQDVKFYGKDYNFTLYALSSVGPGTQTNEQAFLVVASQSFSGTNATAGLQVLPVTNFAVFAGDLLAFCGKGPYYPQSANDGFNSDATYQNPLSPNSGAATPPGGAGTVFTVGLYPDTNATYGYISDASANQGRTYSIGVDVSAEKLFLPVYQITSAGVTLAQASTLANYLNIPVSGLELTNGALSFIDPTNYMYIPMIQGTNSSGDPVQLLDLGALTNLVVYSTNAALNAASNALGAAGLTPQFGTPTILYTVFNGIFTNDDQSITTFHQYLDTKVHYTFSLPAGDNAYPLIGAGAKAIVDFGPAGNVTHVRYAARQLAPGPLVQIISPTEASNRVARVLGPNAQMNMALVYAAPSFEPPSYGQGTWPAWNPTTVIPYYFFRGPVVQTNPITGSNAALIVTEIIPATDDTNYVPAISLSASTLGNTQVLASVSVSGGTPPYLYQWSGSDPSVSTNTGPTVSYTPQVRVEPTQLAITPPNANGMATVWWPYPSTGFVLQATTNLAAGVWSPVTSPVQTNTGVNQVTLTCSNKVLFLRLALAGNTLPATETLSVTVADANGVAVQTNQTLTLLAQVFSEVARTAPIRPMLTDPPTYGYESPYDVDYFDDCRRNWEQHMAGRGGTEVLHRIGYDAWPGDFMEPNPQGQYQWIVPDSGQVAHIIPAGADVRGINTANFVMYFGHGNSNGLSFTWPNWPRNGSPGYNLQLHQNGDGTYPLTAYAQYGWHVEPSGQQWLCPGGPWTLNLTHSWGNYGPSDSLVWLGLSACCTLMWNGENRNDTTSWSWRSIYATDRWGPAFYGLRLLLGYHSDCYRGWWNQDKTWGDFADRMLGQNGHRQEGILGAWFHATEDDQPEGNNNCYCFIPGHGHWNFDPFGRGVGCELDTKPAAMGPFGPPVNGLPQGIGNGDWYPINGPAPIVRILPHGFWWVGMDWRFQYR